MARRAKPRQAQGRDITDYPQLVRLTCARRRFTTLSQFLQFLKAEGVLLVQGAGAAKAHHLILRFLGIDPEKYLAERMIYEAARKGKR